MVRSIVLHDANDLRDFMMMSIEAKSDVGVHTRENQIADGRSILGLIALDYSKPVKIVSDDEHFMKKLDKWAVEDDYC